MALPPHIAPIHEDQSLDTVSRFLADWWTQFIDFFTHLYNEDSDLFYFVIICLVVGLIALTTFIRCIGSAFCCASHR